jgi:fatty acid desaturase
MAVFVVWPSALTLVVAVAVIGSRQLGLFVLMHDASHWLLFRHHQLNSRVVKWLCAYPLGENLPATGEHTTSITGTPSCPTTPTSPSPRYR